MRSSLRVRRRTIRTRNKKRYRSCRQRNRNRHWQTGVYHVYLKLTKRLTNRQVMAVLAILVGGLAGIGAYVFNTLLHLITDALTSWTPASEAQIFYPHISGHRHRPGDALRQVYRRGRHLGGRHARVLYAMSRKGFEDRFAQLLDVDRGRCDDHRIRRFGGPGGSYRADRCGHRLEHRQGHAA